MFYLSALFVFPAAAICLIGTTALLLYRLYISPQAKFPGPRLAAVSRLYELYYDVFRSGGFVCRLRELYEEYSISYAYRVYYSLTFNRTNSLYKLV